MHPTKIRWRESSPVASTTFAFLVGLLTTVVCAWPCGIIAVIAAKRVNRIKIDTVGSINRCLITIWLDVKF